MTIRPALAAAAIMLGLAVSAIAPVVPAGAATSPAGPADVAIVVPLTVPERAEGLISADLLTSYTAEFGLLNRELDQVINRPITIAIDPMIIVSIRILGSSAPESALAWLDRLASATNDTFPLTWADSDITLGLQAGSPVVLAPQSFDFAIDPNNFDAAVPPATETPTPAPTEEPGAEPSFPLPTSESLLAWNYSLPSVAWPAASSATAADFAVVSSEFDTVLLSSDNLKGLSDPTANATVGDDRVLVSNTPLSTAFTDTVGLSSGQDWSSAMASFGTTLTNELARSSSAIIVLDRQASATDPDLSLTIDAIDAHDDVTLVGLSDLAGLSGESATIVDLPQDAAIVQSATRILGIETSDSQFAIVADDPLRVTSARRLELLATLSNGWRTNTLGWANAVHEFTTESSELQSSIQIVRSSAITLWADRGSLPVVVSNDGLDQAVTVYITVKPLSPLVKVENAFVEVRVEPHSQRKAQVPVQSLANGVVELQVSLHRSDGVIVGTPTYVKTTVQAGWETPFTLTIGIVVVLVFIAGIIRNIVRRRKKSGTDDAEDEKTPTAETPSEAP